MIGREPTARERALVIGHIQALQGDEDGRTGQIGQDRYPFEPGIGAFRPVALQTTHFPRK